MQTTPHCPRCGTEYAQGMRYCPACGHDLASPWGPQQPQYEPRPQQGYYRPVKNYLVESILVTIFCCLPVGIAAIIYAAQVDGAVQRGDIAGAQRSANLAKNLTIASLVLGLVGSGIWLFLVLATAPFTNF